MLNEKGHPGLIDPKRNYPAYNKKHIFLSIPEISHIHLYFKNKHENKGKKEKWNHLREY